MSYIRPNYLRDGPGYEFTEEPETGWTCPICGNDVAWWQEPWDKDELGRVCHEECLQKQMEDDLWNLLFRLV